MFRPPPPPPSPRIINEFRDALRICMTLETAATMIKVPQKTLLEWIKYGRRGATEYMAFVDMIDEENASLAQKVLSYLYKAAFAENNLDAVKFLYKHRLQKNEERFAAKVHEIEDRIQEEVVEALDQSAHESELAEAEARLAKH